MSFAASFFVESRKQTLAQAAFAYAADASHLELRLDRAPPELSIEELIRAMPLPVIAACPDHPEARARLSAAARGGARFVDQPLGTQPFDIPPGCRRVHSWHEDPAAPAPALLDVLEELEARRRPGDVVKIVPWADLPEDAGRCLDLYAHARGPLLCFAQGPGGRASRAWALALGAPWSYVHLLGTVDDPTAPGQWNLESLRAVLPEPPRGAECYAVLGRPIAHSRSPLLWNHAFRALGRHAFFLPIAPGELGAFLRSHRHPTLRGLAITAPFKSEALRLADEVDPRARELGAANTLQRLPDGGWKAWNTDGPAAWDALEAAGAPSHGAHALILGAGGAARALLHEGLARGHDLHLSARRPEAAAELCAELGGRPIPWRDFDPRDYTVVIQATPIGSPSRPGDLFADRTFRLGSFFLDVVYLPLWTESMRRARESGAHPVSGAEMLLRQMLAQFRILCAEEAPAAELRHRLLTELSRVSAPLFLIGARATGKSLLGEILAAELDLPFLDSDRLLEERHQRTVAEWVRADLPSFRRAESALLREFLKGPPAVIALGGGVVEDPDNLRLLESHPRVYGLRAQRALRIERQRRRPTRPPLLPGRGLAQEVAILDRRRDPAYARACHGRFVDTDRPPAESLPMLLAQLRRWEALDC